MWRIKLFYWHKLSFKIAVPVFLELFADHTGELPCQLHQLQQFTFQDSQKPVYTLWCIKLTTNFEEQIYNHQLAVLHPSLIFLTNIIYQTRYKTLTQPAEAISKTSQGWKWILKENPIM